MHEKLMTLVTITPHYRLQGTINCLSVKLLEKLNVFFPCTRLFFQRWNLFLNLNY
jgi:hypothetical protein